jgi:FkbM family methyltransferase
MLNILFLDQKYIAYTLDLRRYLLKFLFASHPFSLQMGQAKFLIEPRSTDLFTIYEIYRDLGYLPKLTNMPLNPKTVVDFGANIGVFSIWAFQTFHPQKVFAVEMEVHCFRRLVDNIALNGLTGSVEPIQAAIFDHSGAVSAKKIPGSTFYALAPHANGSMVNSFSFRDFLDITRLDQIDLLKIDIEGAEKYLLTEENASLFQHRVRYILLETHSLNDFRTEQAVAYLSSLGFRLAMTRTPYVLDRNYIIDAYNPG